MRLLSPLSKIALAVIALSAIPLPTRADSTIYSNGPTNGTVSGWSLYYGYDTQNSFTVSATSTLTAVTFGNWLDHGDTAQSIVWSIVSTEGSMTPLCATCSGTAPLSGVELSISGTPDGYDLYNQTFSLPDITLAPGTYWLDLGNENVSGGFGYWDINGGPSMVWETFYGDLSGPNCAAAGAYISALGCSDAFTIYGTTSTSATPEPDSLALLGSALTLLAAKFRRGANRTT